MRVAEPTHAGWYPVSDNSRLSRYWDGKNWTDIFARTPERKEVELSKRRSLMRITTGWLERKSADYMFRLWFETQFPGGAEYQHVLDTLTAENKASWADWLIRRVGPNQ